MDTKMPSPSTSYGHQWKYHVFLSFRGKDTRKSFTDHLYTALKQKGISTFKDDENLDRGKPISIELLRAIEESMFAIVILSKKYASSTWCLDELVKIMECRKKMGLIVLPIFYDVDPFDVRKQTRTFAQAFVKHEKCFKESIKKVQAWRVALREVANLSGWSLNDRHESKFIEDIVQAILHKLSYAFPRDTKGLVGINAQVEELMSLLAIGSNDVRIIGVWGMGGIGKTTLARFVYWMIFNDFQGGSFITNIREESEERGLLPSQQKLICEILRERSMNIRDVDDGVLMIKNRLCHKRIILVLDDVNQFDQLKKLAGEPNWFGAGSRVIITTRDKHLLIRHKVCGIYEVKGLKDDDALHLFSLNSFNKDHPTQDYLKLSKQYVNYAQGIPLAIEVLGSFLFNRSKEEWESALDRLKEFPVEEMSKILQISFDGLHRVEQEIFLHMACFFNMKDKDYVVEILDCLGLHPKIGLNVLIEKSLLKEYENKFCMHELLQKMGQDIIRREYPQEPRKWSRLWQHKDIHNVLMKNMEAEAIQGIVLVLPKMRELGELQKSVKAHWNLDAFSKLPNLKLLIIHGVHLPHGPKHLPNDLRYLDWSRYPSKSLPSSFQPNELVELHMCDSKIVRLWNGIKHFGKLKSIKLEDSLNLIATPDVNGVPNLEKLDVKGCKNLIEIHPSIAVHKRLTHLNLEGCHNLNTLPSKFEMESLEILILSGCSKIKRIPEFMGNMISLSKLHLDRTAITKLPSSIAHLTNLASLHLRDCKNIACLPSIICSFKSLKDVNLNGCSKLDNLPEDLWNLESLEELDVSGIALRELTSSIVLSRNLKRLSFRGCKESPPKLWNKLFSFNLMPPGSLNPMSLLSPSLPGLCYLKKLDLSDCNLQTIPNDFGYLSSLICLNLSENTFDCLPESIIQLSKLTRIYLRNCTRLCSLPQFPSSTWMVDGCSSSKPLPNRLTLDKFCQPRLFLFNCFNLADNLGRSDMFFRMLSVVPQDIDKESIESTLVAIFGIVIPGSEIPRWFSHQSVGPIVNAQVTHPKKNVLSKWIGMAVCVVFSGRNLHPNNHVLSNYLYLSCEILVNKDEGATISEILGKKSAQIKSDHLWQFYLPPQNFNENGRALLSQIDENGFIQIEVRFDCPVLQCLEVKKCGFRLVYKQDIEDIRYMMAHSSNNTCITPYEGLDVHHDFDNSAEAIKIKGSHDEYDRAGPSDEGRLGSSFDVPHSKKIERYIKDVWLMVTSIILTLIMVTLIARIVMKVTRDWCMELRKEEMPQY